MRLAYFGAEWCGVCHAKRPVAEEVARAEGLPLETWDWDAEDGRARAEALRIRMVPPSRWWTASASASAWWGR